jgi:hypothetical protein
MSPELEQLLWAWWERDTAEPGQRARRQAQLDSMIEAVLAKHPHLSREDFFAGAACAVSRVPPRAAPTTDPAAFRLNELGFFCQRRAWPTCTRGTVQSPSAASACGTFWLRAERLTWPSSACRPAGRRPPAAERPIGWSNGRESAQTSLRLPALETNSPKLEPTQVGGDRPVALPCRLAVGGAADCQSALRHRASRPRLPTPTSGIWHPASPSSLLASHF